MRKVLGVMALVTAAACGGMGSSAGVDSQSDVQTFAALATEVSSAASSYATAAQATTDVAGCQAVHRAYDDHVRPDVERMQQMSPAMDGTISGMASMMATANDVGCASDAMRAELDRHAAAACASADMATNHAEAERHAGAMDAWAEHQVARCSEVQGHVNDMPDMPMMPMGASTTPTTPAPVCQKMADGSFELGGVHP
jgi:hypothetical protein